MVKALELRIGHIKKRLEPPVSPGLRMDGSPAEAPPPLPEGTAKKLRDDLDVAEKQLVEAKEIDDVVLAIPVHLFCGMWGCIAVGLFTSPLNAEAAFSADTCGIFYGCENGWSQLCKPLHNLVVLHFHIIDQRPGPFWWSHQY